MKGALLGIALLLLARGALAQGAPESPALSLTRVLESVEQHHPRIAAALANENAARGELLSANGGFDPQLDASAAVTTGDGYYELRRLGVELRQPTSVWGTELWVGYRRGIGVDGERYPSYYSDQTLDNGEVRAGMRVPLWRNGPIDERRAAQQRAEHRLDATTSRRHAAGLELRQGATDAYLAWVAAGRRVAMAQELLGLALRRKEWVRASTASGDMAPVEELEAERAVLQRERFAFAAKRGLRQTSLVLGLFVRDGSGAPRAPAVAELPPEIVRPDALSPNTVDAFRAARQCHPLLLAKRGDLRAAQTDEALARGQNSPRLDVQGQVSRDLGEGSATLPGTVIEAGVVFSMPLAMRQPRGQVRATESRVRALEQEVRLLEDTIRMQLEDAASAFSVANDQWQLALRLIDNTRALAEAERARFEAGTTTLFVVNQREQAIAEAELALVDSAREAWLARAQWELLTSCGG